MYEVRTIGGLESQLGRACECADRIASGLGQAHSAVRKVNGAIGDLDWWNPLGSAVRDYLNEHKPDPLQAADHVFGPQGWGSTLKLVGGVALVAGVVGGGVYLYRRHTTKGRKRSKKR